MIKLPESNFQIIPEGPAVLLITDVEYNSRFGKLTVNMATADGLKHSETYRLIKANGEMNEGAYKAFAYFARTALQKPHISEVDESELVGHFIACDVEHDVQPNRNDPSKTVTFVHLKNWKSADGFEMEPAELDLD